VNRWTKARIRELERRLGAFREACRATTLAAVEHATRSPYALLVSCVISLRTKDEVTAVASRRLLALPGVGRKTANLVLGLGFAIPAICVDTHVHRISNRLGLVETSSPHATELALQGVLPRSLWIPINDLLVTFGQNRCHPVSPRCTGCPLDGLCPRIGVTHHR